MALHAAPGTGWLNLLDKVPASVRHALILLIGAGLSWVSANLPDWHLQQPYPNLIGAAVAMLLLIVTPLTSQYGVGKAANDKAQAKADLEAAEKLVLQAAQEAAAKQLGVPTGVDIPPAPAG
jgi:hypothetical protein